MRNLSYKTWIARSLARALLADAHQPGGTRLAALRALMMTMQTTSIRTKDCRLRVVARPTFAA